MAESLKWPCHACGSIGFDDGSDGFFYCRRCGSQADDIIDTGVADEDFVTQGGGAIYLASHRRQRTVKEEPISQSQPVPYQSQLWQTLNPDDHENNNNSNKNVKKEELYDDYEDYVDTVGPTGPTDFGSSLGVSRGPSFEDYYNEVRMKYVMGVQLMIQFQCRALVEKFGANPLVCGFAGTIWLRFVAVSRVFDDGWADEAVQQSEMQKLDIPENFRPRAKYRVEPHNLHGERAIMIWFRALRKRIPLSCSLAVSFLACHIAREAILPTDIVMWSLEGKLPYFAAFVEIEEHIGRPSNACPLSSSLMFRPSQAVPLQKLESMAASIAKSIGLNLPPVNFYAIASRFLKLLSLPHKEILLHACRVYEWSMSPDLWLSSNELRLPTRVCVMSILIVAIRILYNINGFGKWETALSRINHSSFSSDHEGKLDLACSSESEDGTKQGSGFASCNLDSSSGPASTSSFVKKSELDAAEVLYKLEGKYYEIDNTYEYSKDLPKFLNFCKDVAFAGLEPSFDYHEEEKIIEQLWNYYNDEKDVEPSEHHRGGFNSVLNQKRSRDYGGHVHSPSKEGKKFRGKGCISNPSSDNTFYTDDYPENSFDGAHSSASLPEAQNLAPSFQESADNIKDETIRRLKSDMEENRFCYIPPRVNLKRFDYLHYSRKKDEGALIYVAHADYYILLRACAKVARVDTRIMHIGVLSLERRLAWLEKRIDHCLHLTPPNTSCEFCSDVAAQDAMDDCMGLSGLKICDMRRISFVGIVIYKANLKINWMLSE